MPKIDIQNLEKEIKSIVAEITEIDLEKIASDVNFINDLGMDSMMALEILAAIEKKYKIQIPEENLAKMTTLKQVTELVNGFLNK